jgi:hypothetical protein
MKTGSKIQNTIVQNTSIIENRAFVRTSIDHSGTSSMEVSLSSLDVLDGTLFHRTSVDVGGESAVHSLTLILFHSSFANIKDSRDNER